MVHYINSSPVFIYNRRNRSRRPALGGLSDLCVDANQERHDACMDAVFPTLARVMPSDEWLAALGRPGGGGGPDDSPQKTAAGALRGLL